jgi:hypothetical protein
MSNGHTNELNLESLNEIKKDVIIYSACSKNKRLFKQLQSAKSLCLIADKEEIKKKVELIKNEFPINMPTIHHETDLKSIFSCYQLIDTPMPFSRYYADWIFFIALNFIDKQLIKSLICITLEEKLKIVEENDVCDLLDKLWADRWFFDARDYASIRFHITKKNIQQQRLKFPDIIESRLSHAKQNSCSLDEWFEHLYRLKPFALYGQLLFNNDKSENGQKYCRYCDEISADIYAITLYCMTEGVIKGKNEPLTDAYLYFLNEAESDETKIKRKMSYYLNARVTYPKFWYEKALNLVLSKQTTIPSELNDFDHGMLTSSIIMILGPDIDKDISGEKINELKNNSQISLPSKNSTNNSPLFNNNLVKSTSIKFNDFPDIKNMFWDNM